MSTRSGYFGEDFQLKNTVGSKNNLLGIISALAIFSSLYLVNNNFISAVGGCAAVGSLLFCALMLVVNYRRVKCDFTTIMVLLIGLSALIQIIWYGRPNALYSVMQMLGLLFVYVSLSKTRINLLKFNKYKKYLRAFYYTIMLIYFVAFIANKVEILHQFVSPTILKILFPLSFFAIKRNSKIAPLEIGIFVIFHFLLGERTAGICMLLVEFFRVLLKRSKSKTSNFLFWAVAIIAIAIPFLYVWLYEQPFGQSLNLYVRELTGENFFSGRNRIWGVIIDGIAGNRFWGLGFGNTFLSDHGITLSTHNLYMFLYLNGGGLFVVLFILFMYGIWKDIKMNSISDKSIVTEKAYILALLLFLDFELFLLANNIVISLFWWITLALISVKNKSSREGLYL